MLRSFGPNAGSRRRLPSGDGDRDDDDVWQDDAALVQALKAQVPEASTRLFDRYGAYLRGVLLRTLGADPDLTDLLHDVFVRAMEGIHRLESGRALRAWLTQTAVFTARGAIVKRQRRRRWQRLLGDVPTTPSPPPDPAISAAVTSAFAALDRLAPDDRIAFCLRRLEQMEISEVATACRVSLSTAKRRLRRAEAKFLELTKDDPVLAPWTQEGGRWTR
jgi:RNA polymerase sigma-70 factor (ECF subfamily)